MNLTIFKNFKPNISSFGVLVFCVTWLINTFSVPIINGVNSLGRPAIWVVIAGLILFMFLLAWNINQQKQIDELADKKESKEKRKIKTPKKNDDPAGIRDHLDNGEQTPIH